MFEDYNRYLQKLNNSLRRSGVSISILDGVSKDTISEDAEILNRFFDVNEILDKGGAVKIFHSEYDETTVKHIRKKLFEEYLEYCNKEMEKLLENPEGAGVQDRDVKVLNAKDIIDFNEKIGLVMDSMEESSSECGYTNTMNSSINGIEPSPNSAGGSYNDEDNEFEFDDGYGDAEDDMVSADELKVIEFHDAITDIEEEDDEFVFDLDELEAIEEAENSDLDWEEEDEEDFDWDGELEDEEDDLDEEDYEDDDDFDWNGESEDEEDESDEDFDWNDDADEGEEDYEENDDDDFDWDGESEDDLDEDEDEEDFVWDEEDTSDEEDYEDDDDDFDWDGDAEEDEEDYEDDDDDFDWNGESEEDDLDEEEYEDDDDDDFDWDGDAEDEDDDSDYEDWLGIEEDDGSTDWNTNGFPSIEELMAESGGNIGQTANPQEVTPNVQNLHKQPNLMANTLRSLGNKAIGKGKLLTALKEQER